MKNNLIFTENEISPNVKIKHVNELTFGDILKRKDDGMYYAYNGEYDLESTERMNSKLMFINFFGCIIPKFYLGRFFYTERNDFKVYSLKKEIEV